MRKVHGFTLAEIAVVSTVIIGVTLSISSIVTVMNKSSGFTRLNSDVDLVLEAMNQFYHLNCNNALAPALTVAQLKTDNLLLLNQFSNPFGSNPTISIDRTNTLNPILKVTATFTNSQLAQDVASYRNYAIAVGTTVTWSKNSTLSRTTEGLSRQLDREIFGSNLC